MPESHHVQTDFEMTLRTHQTDSSHRIRATATLLLVLCVAGCSDGPGVTPAPVTPEAVSGNGNVSRGTAVRNDIEIDSDDLVAREELRTAPISSRRIRNDVIRRARERNTPNKTGPRRVIVHADDAGMCRSVNRGTIEALEAGIVTSTSIMVPCPAFEEFADYARTHPEYDYGIHLTLNAEFQRYRWGPVLSRRQVPSLVDRHGFLWETGEEVAAKARGDEVEKELRAQIDRALELGVPLSHLDTHMGTLLRRPDLLEIYVRLGLDYGLPILLPRSNGFVREIGAERAVLSELDGMIRTLEKNEYPVLDSVQMHYSRDSVSSKRRAYLNMIRRAPVGVTEIIVHCGYSDSELRSISLSHGIRDGDRRVFTDRSVISEIQNSGVDLINWRQFHQMASTPSDNANSKNIRQIAETATPEMSRRTTSDERYLIIHADDVGMCRSVNKGTIEALEAGVVTSASIMVPCPAFEDFAQYAREHPEYDYGVHLTLNAEWPRYRWGPVLPHEEVPSLVDRRGYLWRSEDDVASNARADDVERELRAQIDRAKDFGIRITHLDTHMGTLFTRPDFLEIYVRLGLDYDLPILMPRDDRFLKQLGVGDQLKTQKADMMTVLEKRNYPILDTVLMHYEEDSLVSKRKEYLDLIRTVPRGVSQLIIHCGVADGELKSIMSNYAIRSGDRSVFTDPAVIAEIKASGVKLINWKQLHQMTTR